MTTSELSIERTDPTTAQVVELRDAARTRQLV